MRVLMISKALVVGMYQKKLEALAAQPDLDLTAVVPKVWADRSGPQRLERAFTQGYQLVVAPVRFNGNYHLHHFPTLGRIMQETRPDVVHIDEEPYNLAAWHALALARRHGAKAVFFSWQNIARRYPPPFSWGERWALRHIDHAIMGTQSAAEVWRAKGYHGPHTVIPQFGIDPDLFPYAPTFRRDYGDSAMPSLDEVTPVIGYVGRLVPEKGIDVLIRAVEMLQVRAKLIIVGQGPERDALMRQIARTSPSVVEEFVGAVPSVQMPTVYPRLHVLVLPSRTMPNWKEQFGRVLVEAMACGVPVIGSDSGAIPNVIGGAGLVVPEGDPQALKNALAEVLYNMDTRIRLVEAGRQRVLNHFTHAQIAAQTAEVYRQMLR